MGGSSSPRHSDKCQSAAAAAAAAAASSAQAQVQAAATAAFNYSAFLNASVSGGSGVGAGVSGDSAIINSTESLLRNIQSLLKVAAENARQQDRQANYEKGESSRLSFRHVNCAFFLGTMGSWRSLLYC